MPFTQTVRFANKVSATYLALARWKKIFAAGAFVFAAVLISHLISSAQLTEIKLGGHPENLNSRDLSFPIQLALPPSAAPAQLAFEIAPGFTFSSHLTLSSDRCLRSVRVEDQMVWVEGQPQQNCRHDFELPSLYWVKSAGNRIGVTLSEDKTYSGYFELSAQMGTLRKALVALFTVAAIWSLLGVLVPLGRLSAWQRGLVLAGIFVHLFAFEVTPSHVRSYDFHGHLAYLFDVLAGTFFPNQNACWECHQPPLYYWLGATFLKLTDWSASLGDLRLPLLSLFLFSGFTVYSLLFVNRFVKEQPIGWLVSLLFVSWPSGFFHSTRVSNDIPAYLSFAACIFYFSEWERAKDKRDFRRALLAAFLGLLTKLTAGMGLLYVLAMLVIRRKTGSTSATLRPIAAVAAILGTAVLAGALILGIRTLQKSSPVARVSHGVSQVGLPPNYGGQRADSLPVSTSKWIGENMRVKNSPGHLLGFSFYEYLASPFVNPFSDEGGRQYFWVYLAKTSLWGDFVNYPARTAAFARGINVLLLFVVGFALVGAVVTVRGRRKFRESIELYVLVGLYLLALLAYRLKAPYSCNGDFRFIYPALPAMLAFAYRGMVAISGKRQKNSTLKKWLIFGPTLAFAAGSVAFLGLLAVSY